MLIKSERGLQIAVVTYIKLRYPDVVLIANTQGEIKVSPQKGAILKRMGNLRGQPDLFLAASKNDYSGLFIELKVKRLNTDHEKEQEIILKKLTDAGYLAVFAVGFDEARKIIDEYLK